ncbi:MAG: hypothetical protein ACRD5R_08895 [Candidatus Acidiferrales bacterium]
MEDDKLIERLEEGVREAEDLLQRRKQALAALKGKSGSGKKGVRGLRPGSIPALAQVALRSKQPATLEELTAQIKKTDAETDARKVSLALSRYVRLGRIFVVTAEGKYLLK